MPADVIHMGTGRPLDEVIAEQSEQELLEIEAEDMELSEYQESMIAMLDRVMKLVAEGRLVGLMVLGKDPVTDLFLTEVHLRCPHIDRQDMFSYMGVLETLKLEMSEAASMAPVITSTGTILDPFEEPDQSEFDFEDDE